LVRLPLDTEWTTAAGGEIPPERFPWDLPGKVTKDEKEIVLHANMKASHIGHTTPVNAYLHGASSHGVMDMAGNVWEWQANYQNMNNGWLGLHGGSWFSNGGYGHVSIRRVDHPDLRFYGIGFRVVALPLKLSS
jgi:formylglycine-generating enzyme required for sulfatase activity